jgi:hypothetical protein
MLARACCGAGTRCGDMGVVRGHGGVPARRAPGTCTVGHRHSGAAARRCSGARVRWHGGAAACGCIGTCARAHGSATAQWYCRHGSARESSAQTWWCGDTVGHLTRCGLARWNDGEGSQRWCLGQWAVRPCVGTVVQCIDTAVLCHGGTLSRGCGCTMARRHGRAPARWFAVTVTRRYGSTLSQWRSSTVVRRQGGTPARWRTVSVVWRHGDGLSRSQQSDNTSARAVCADTGLRWHRVH